MTDPLNTPIHRRSALRGIVTLAGVAVALPALSSMTGCSQAVADIADKTDLIASLAERIIPATDTPGAVEAEVPAYIAAVFGSHFSPDQQSEFANGLAVFDELAQASGARSFSDAPDDIKDQILSALDGGDGSMEGHTTWRNVREMTIFGYYTSELATQELSFEELPGRYVGCLPLKEVGHAWLDRGV